MLRYIPIMTLSVGLATTSAQANPVPVRAPVGAPVHAGAPGLYRTGSFSNYHLQYGRSFNYGYYYPGQFHRHWSYCYWDARYRTYLYFDPCVRSYYFYSQRDTSYYPVSYWSQRSCCCACSANAGPVDPSVRVMPAPQGASPQSPNGVAPRGPGGNQSAEPLQIPQGPGPQGPANKGFNGPAPKGPQAPQGQQQPGGMIVDQTKGGSAPKLGPAPPPIGSMARAGETTKGSMPAGLAAPKTDIPGNSVVGPLSPRSSSPRSLPTTPIEPVNPEIAQPRALNGISVNPIPE